MPSNDVTIDMRNNVEDGACRWLAMQIRNLGLSAILFSLAGCDAAIIGGCSDRPNTICGISRPEDIEQIPNSRWMLVREWAGPGESGRILALDPDTRERLTLIDGEVPTVKASNFPMCGPPPETLFPRGFHLSYGDDDKLHLLLISNDRIERFLIEESPDGVSAAWEGCVDIPEGILANDVAGFGDGSFVVSHMFDPPRSFWMNMRFLLGLDTGYVMGWQSQEGWRRLPNTDASFANGIQIEPITSRIYVSSMFTHRVFSVDRNGNNRKESSRTVSQMDNLSWASDGRLIGAGHTGVAVYGVSACRDIGSESCGFPFAIIAFDPETLESEVIFETGTSEIPGASVAVLRNGFMYLGTAYGDRITRISINSD